MSTLALKKKIVSALENITDVDFLEGIYAIVNNKASNIYDVYTDELKAELDVRSEYIKQGKAKMMTVNEVRTNLTKKLKY